MADAPRKKLKKTSLPTGVSLEQYTVLRAVVRAFIVKRPTGAIPEHRVSVSPADRPRHSVLVWADLYDYCNMELMAAGHVRIKDSRDFLNALCVFKPDGEAAPLLDGESHTHSAHFCVDRGSKYHSISRTHTWNCDPVGHTLFCVNSVSERAEASRVLAPGQQWDGRRRFELLWQPMEDSVERCANAGGSAGGGPEGSGFEQFGPVGDGAERRGADGGRAEGADGHPPVALHGGVFGGAPPPAMPATRVAAIPSPPPALPSATSPAVRTADTADTRARTPFAQLTGNLGPLIPPFNGTADTRARTPFAQLTGNLGPLIPQFNGALMTLPAPPPPQGKLSKVDQAFETGRREGLREAQAAQAKEQQLDRERLVAIAEYDLAQGRLVFRIQGGAGVKVLVRLKREATQSGGRTTSTTTSYTDMVDVAAKYPSACGVGVATGGDGGSGGGCMYHHDPAGALPRAESVIRRTGWLTLGYELAAMYGLGKHGSKTLREVELNEQSALYMRTAADSSFIELAVFLEHSDLPESQDSHGSGSLGAMFSADEDEAPVAVGASADGH